MVTLHFRHYPRSSSADRTPTPKLWCSHDGGGQQLGAGVRALTANFPVKSCRAGWPSSRLSSAPQAPSLEGGRRRIHSSPREALCVVAGLLSLRLVIYERASSQW